MGFSDIIRSLKFQQMANNNGRGFKCPPFKETAPGELSMDVLPTGKICIRGQKLDNAPLPDDWQDQLQILIGVANWFRPCTQIETNLASRQCFKIQRLRLSQLKYRTVSFSRKFWLDFLQLKNKIRKEGTQNLISM